MDQRSEEIDGLRRRLVAAYGGACYDANAAGECTARLRELVSVMNVIDDKKIIELRQLYDDGIGVRAASRRLFINRNTALRYYHEFRLAGRKAAPAVVPLGEPSPDRSALNGFKPWQPTYNDKPHFVRRLLPREALGLDKPKSPKIEFPESPVDKWGYSIPTADHVAMAIVLATHVTGGDPILVASGGNFQGARLSASVLSNSRARVYAALALQEVFSGMSSPGIAKLVGASSSESYFASIRQRQKAGNLKWMDQKVVDSIVRQLSES